MPLSLGFGFCVRCYEPHKKPWSYCIHVKKHRVLGAGKCKVPLRSAQCFMQHGLDFCSLLKVWFSGPFPFPDIRPQAGWDGMFRALAKSTYIGTHPPMNTYTHAHTDIHRYTHTHTWIMQEKKYIYYDHIHTCMYACIHAIRKPQATCDVDDSYLFCFLALTLRTWNLL